MKAIWLFSAPHTLQTGVLIKPETTAASTKLRLTWAAMKVKPNPNPKPARAGSSCP